MNTRIKFGLAAAGFAGLVFGAGQAVAAFVVSGEVMGQLCGADGCVAKTIDEIKGGDARALRVGGVFKDVTEFDPETGVCRIRLGEESGLIAAATKFIEVQHDGAEVVLNINFIAFDCRREE